MHPLPGRHWLALACRVPDGGRPRATARDRLAARSHDPNRGPHDLRVWRCGGLAGARSHPAFPSGDRAAHRPICRQSAPGVGKGIRRRGGVENRMVDAPDNLIFEYLRRLDTKLDRVIEDIGDLKIRMTAVEEKIAQVELSIAGVNRRIDRVEARLDRIERRLDLVELPH